LDEEPVVWLQLVLDAVEQKHSLAAALILQYRLLLEEAINPSLPLVSYAKESMALDPLNVTMVMFDLLKDSKKAKEEWKFVLTATGPWLVIVTVTGTVLQLA
jgi:hypothetical protein